jgi:hypothetical protein
MWKLVLIVLVLLFLTIKSPNILPIQNGGSNSNLLGAPYKNSNLYYQQHSHFPYGAWWIPFSDPLQKCQKHARENCHEEYLYDDCYARTLNHCLWKNPNLPPFDQRNQIPYGRNIIYPGILAPSFR